jgi:hypothetical protein
MLSNEVVAALVGAIFGSLLTGLSSWILARQSLKAAKLQSDTSFARERMLYPHTLRLQRLFELADKVGFVLARGTPSMLKRDKDPGALQVYLQDLFAGSRAAYLIGIEHGTLEPVYRYCNALERYLEDKISDEEIERMRRECSRQMRDNFSEIQHKLTSGDLRVA